MSKDYRHISIGEAAAKELTSSLVNEIKKMDSIVATNRLYYLLMCAGYNITFTDLCGQFIALSSSTTGVDNE